MSIREIKGFVKAVQTLKAQEQISFLLNTAIAAQGTSKSIKKSVSSIQKQFLETYDRSSNDVE